MTIKDLAEKNCPSELRGEDRDKYLKHWVEGFKFGIKSLPESTVAILSLDIPELEDLIKGGKV